VSGAGRPTGARQPYDVLADRSRNQRARYRARDPRFQCPLVDLHPPLSAAASLGAGAAFPRTFDTAITHAARCRHEDLLGSWQIPAVQKKKRIGCMLSGARRVHPVIVGWSTANRPLMLMPSPSMIIQLPHGLGQLPGETGS
jgi:hypothetical protein